MRTEEEKGRARDRLLARIRDRMPQLWKRLQPGVEDLRDLPEVLGGLDPVEYPLPGYPRRSLRWAPDGLLLRQVCPTCGAVFERVVLDVGELVGALSVGWPWHGRADVEGRVPCPTGGTDL